MFEAHELEQMVIDLRHQASKTSNRVMEEVFGEHIERKLLELPENCLEEFFNIATEHGYQPLSGGILILDLDEEDGIRYDDLAEEGKQFWLD